MNQRQRVLLWSAGVACLLLPGSARGGGSAALTMGGPSGESDAWSLGGENGWLNRRVMIGAGLAVVLTSGDGQMANANPLLSYDEKQNNELEGHGSVGWDPDYDSPRLVWSGQLPFEHQAPLVGGGYHNHRGAVGRVGLCLWPDPLSNERVDRCCAPWTRPASWGGPGAASMAREEPRDCYSVPAPPSRWAWIHEEAAS